MNDLRLAFRQFVRQPALGGASPRDRRHLWRHRLQRCALGAQTADILRLIVGQGMIPVAIGLVTGLTTAFALGSLLASQLDEVSAHNPALLAATVFILAVVALLACLIPARRASLGNPIEALRTE